MTIRHKKIPNPQFGGGPAYTISNEISTKAFSHLIDPLQKKLNDLALRAYTHALESVGINFALLAKMDEAGLIHCYPSVPIELVDSSGNEITVVATTGGDEDRFAYCGAALTIENSAMHDEAQTILEELNPLLAKRNDLCGSLYAQIAGRSTKEVIENWPEAAEIVARVMGLGPVPEMIRPLEVLLGRFLPALPAPKEK